MDATDLPKPEQEPGSAPSRRDASAGSEPTRSMPAVTRSPEPTQQIPATQLPLDEQNRRLAAELARRGVPADEVERLLALDRARPQPAPQPASAPVVAAPAEPAREDDYVPQPTIELPPFRESSAREKADADRFLTTANLARRRGQFKEAEEACRRAVELIPRDAPALELYGDVLQSVGRVDDALYCYQRASEADPKRTSAERKYAELRLLQNRDIDRLREEYIPRNPVVAALFSLLCPGAGQVYNAQPVKGLVLAFTMLVWVLLLGWTPLGVPGAQGAIPFSLVFLGLLAVATDAYAVIDAYLGARGGGPKSGWEI